VLAKSHIRALFLHEKDSRPTTGAILMSPAMATPLPLEHVVWLGDESWQAMIAGGTIS